jgi:hypothetical protein
MIPEQAHPGTRVGGMEHHGVAERRGLVGKVVALYGGEEYIAVNMRLADGQYRLFWPRDLEEISPPSPSGLVALPARWGRLRLTHVLIQRSAWKGDSRNFALTTIS